MNGRWRVLAARAMGLNDGRFTIMRHNVTEGPPEKKAVLVQRAKDKKQDVEKSRPGASLGLLK